MILFLQLSAVFVIGFLAGAYCMASWCIDVLDELDEMHAKIHNGH